MYYDFLRVCIPAYKSASLSDVKNNLCLLAYVFQHNITINFYSHDSSVSELVHVKSAAKSLRITKFESAPEYFYANRRR